MNTSFTSNFEVILNEKHKKWNIESMSDFISNFQWDSLSEKYPTSN